MKTNLSTTKNSTSKHKSFRNFNSLFSSSTSGFKRNSPVRKVLVMEEINGNLTQKNHNTIAHNNIIYDADTEINKLTPYQRIMLDKDINKHFLKQKIDTNKNNQLFIKHSSQILNRLTKKVGRDYTSHGNGFMKNFNSNKMTTKSTSTETSILDTMESYEHIQRKKPVGIPKQFINRKGPLFLTSDYTNNSIEILNTHSSIPSKQMQGFQIFHSPTTDNFDSSIPNSLKEVFKKTLGHNNNLDSINLSKIDKDILLKSNKIIKSYEAKKFINLKKSTISLLEK